MTDRKKYHAAIEIKEIVSLFLRSVDKIYILVREAEDENLSFEVDKTITTCKELLKKVKTIAIEERPPVKTIDNIVDNALEWDICNACSDDCNTCKS